MKKKTALSLILALLLTLSLSLSAFASYQGVHLDDQAGALTAEQAANIEAAAAQLSAQYDCGVYVAITTDYSQYSDVDEIDASWVYFDQMGLGEGFDGDGVLLFLDIDYRSATVTVGGDYAGQVFSDAATWYMEDQYLPSFGNNDWYGGVVAYLNGCDRVLNGAVTGDNAFLDEYDTSSGSALIVFGGAFVVALIVCFFLMAQMKSARRQTSASAYVAGAGARFRAREDRYTHSTETRVKIKTESSGGGGTTRSGGGHSSRSSRF